ncbi:MAG: ABC transporter ATP-binding protein [Atopobiaceae bacterium]|nr:ABC transporter ATP-binding protein [Atopobiaceae bacterium]
MPGPHSSRGDLRRARDTKGAALRLLGYLKPYAPQLALVVAMTLATSAFSVLQPSISGDITTELYNGVTSGQFAWPSIMRLLLTLVGIYLASSAFQVLQGIIMNRMTTKVLQGMRDEIDEKVHRLPLDYYDARTSGEILSIITNDVDMVDGAISRNLTQLVSQLVMVVGIFVMMVRISGWLTLIAVLMVPVSLVASLGVITKSRTYFADQQSQLGDLNGYIEELYDGQNVVQAFNYQARAIERFDELNERLATTARKASVTSGAVRPITTTVTNLGYALSAALGCLFALQGRITVGDVQAMLQYSRQFSQPFTQIAAMAGGLAAAMAAAERIFDLLDATEQLPDPDQVRVPDTSEGRVAFEHVRFGYAPGKELMHDVSFAVEPGQKVAIVGPTGAGKTTLVNLLMRFYEVDGGDIVVDGVPSREMARAELRSRFGMVLQDTWLFEGTVRDNLAYGREGATDEDVVRAAKAASVDSIIRTMPGSYDMVLSSGAENVSQGERQLLTIARALVADPEIMILDEATSNVDARTEQVIQEAMASLLQGRTSFVIAHRLSTIRDADKILYMEHGDILEAGTHDELMTLDGRYAALYNSQFA